MRRRIGGAVLLLGLAGHAGAAQQVPGASAPPTAKQDWPDIIVNGRTPMMTRGLWRFDHFSGLILREQGRTGAGPPPRHWQVYLAAGDSAAVIRRLVGGAPAAGGSEICGKMRVTIDTRRVWGGQSCTAIFHAGTMVRRSLRFSATLAAERMKLFWRNRVSMSDADSDAGLNWHMAARRLGESPAAVTAPATVQQRPSAPRPAASPAEPTDIPEGPRHAAVPLLERSPTPQARGDDIVVVARKLRRLRLHYASSGAS